ncbi:hypothetical protein VTH82DRAFT_383 [Thermothelomyces myriococcoides]
MSSSRALLFQGNTALLAGSIGAALLYLALVRSRPSRGRMAVKTASTALLSAMAAVQGGHSLLVAALALGSLGDAFLAWDDNGSFLRGLTSFLVAHLLYIVVFRQNSANVTGGPWVLFRSWRAPVAGSLILLVSVMIIKLVPRIDQGLRPPVVLYSMTILVMALTALAVASSRVVAGSLMFSASDAILATDRFLVSPASTHRKWMQPAVWVLYYFGQLLIALGLLSL